MKKIIISFLCGAVFFSGLSFAAEQINIRYVDFKVVLNGEEVELQNRPMLKDGGTTVLPLREVAELTGLEVDFKDGVIYMSETKSEIDEKNVIDLPQENSEEIIKGFLNPVNPEFTPLPISFERDGIVITIHSLTIGEISTEFNITVENNSDGNARMYWTMPMRVNHNIEGKETRILGTGSYKEFDKIIRSGESVTGVVNKGKINEDDENLVFNFGINGSGNPIGVHIDLTK